MSIPSTLGAVTFFILASTAGAALTLLVAMVLDVTPEANRRAFQGVVVAFSSRPGFFAPFITGVLIPSIGNQVAIGLHNAYVLAAVLLLVGRVGSLVFVRPDGVIRSLSTASGS